MGGLNPASPLERHLHLIAGDQIKDAVRSGAGKGQELASLLFAIGADHIIGIIFQAGNDLPAIAPRGPPAAFTRLKHYGFDASFRQMQSSGQSGIAAAHNANIGLQILR